MSIEREIAAPWIPASTLRPEDETLVLVMIESPRRPALGMLLKGEWRVRGQAGFVRGGEKVVAWKKMPTPTRGWTLAAVLQAVLEQGMTLPTAP